MSTYVPKFLLSIVKKIQCFNLCENVKVSKYEIQRFLQAREFNVLERTWSQFMTHKQLNTSHLQNKLWQASMSQLRYNQKGNSWIQSYFYTHSLMFQVFNYRWLLRARSIPRCFRLRLLTLLTHSRGLAALAAPFFWQLDDLSSNHVLLRWFHRAERLRSSYVTAACLIRQREPLQGSSANSGQSLWSLVDTWQSNILISRTQCLSSRVTIVIYLGQDTVHHLIIAHCQWVFVRLKLAWQSIHHNMDNNRFINKYRVLKQILFIYQLLTVQTREIQQPTYICKRNLQILYYLFYSSIQVSEQFVVLQSYKLQLISIQTIYTRNVRQLKFILEIFDTFTHVHLAVAKQFLNMIYILSVRKVYAYVMIQ
ncbi:Hypothetical_protein [Hexamita inflata]|uniref:Hypothetical_protein n=1 Tax=Hexamita inflata TaxID=28002 RepID=A0AA86NA57_9EUKA|nr:Hypothetical protein HINF_LOCUS3098 [Hexamita inflata]